MTLERVQKLEERIEQIIKENHCEDREIQEALLTVAKDHIWRRGLWARIKYLSNLIGALGIIGTFIFSVAYFFGWEWVRRSRPRSPHSSSPVRGA